MSDALDPGITVTPIQAMDEPVALAAHTTAAFVGCALRGPLNTPIAIDSFAAFAQRFGGSWSRSSLGPAVQQFFEHGGCELYVVRVANNARGAIVHLNTASDVFALQALEPGSTERIRAAVDYDGCADEHTFNLTLQRVAPSSGLVVDQEIYRRASVNPEHRRYIADALTGSSLARAELPTPTDRPLPTGGQGTDLGPSYVEHARRGTDGEALSDYDLIGSAQHRAGMFALNALERFDLLYLPPSAPGSDLGPAAVLAAELYARERGAMLILDPPAAWSTVDDAIEGVRNAGYASANVLSYFPRMLDRDDPNAPPRAVGGAIAGLLCKLDAHRGPWEDLDQTGLALKRRLKPAVKLEPAQGAALVHEGLNVIAGSSGGRALVCGSVTLARDAELERHFTSLTTRRLCLSLTANIGRATRWAVFESGGTRVAERVRAQVHAYLTALADMGAFEEGSFEVQCDAPVHQSPLDPARGVHILVGFRPLGSSETLWLTLHQTVQGLKVSTTAFAPSAEECA